MLLAGVHLDADATTATGVLIDQDFSHLKKHYRLLSIHRYAPMPQPAGIEAVLARIYTDRRYRSRKRIFSQDGRPAKTIRTHPKIIVHVPVGCTATIDALRRKGIPVEGIFSGEGQAWRQDTAEKGLGRNYHVSTDALEAALSRVISEQRLAYEESVELATGPRRDRSSRQALAAAVWFRETIRYTRSYRA